MPLLLYAATGPPDTPINYRAMGGRMQSARLECRSRSGPDTADVPAGATSGTMKHESKKPEPQASEISPASHPTSLRLAFADLKRERVPLVVLALAAVLLVFAEYYFLPGSFRETFPGLTAEYAPALLGLDSAGPWWGALLPFLWWTGGLLLLWVAIPLVAARLLGFHLRDLGLSARGLLRKLPIYGVLYLLVMGGVFWASRQQSFLGTYPMLKPHYAPVWSWALLLSWWAVYAVQFFCVEFFFRGFLLFTLEKRFGMAAVAIMVVPYCMIHFHKPLPEALGAIIAGTVLGWLALRTRSIWGGVICHAAVAISMDALALTQQKAGFPDAW